MWPKRWLRTFALELNRPDYLKSLHVLITWSSTHPVLTFHSYDLEQHGMPYFQYLRSSHVSKELSFLHHMLGSLRCPSKLISISSQNYFCLRQKTTHYIFNLFKTITCHILQLWLSGYSLSLSMLPQFIKNLKPVSLALPVSFMMLFTWFAPSMFEVWRKACTEPFLYCCPLGPTFSLCSLDYVSFDA